MTDTYLVDWQFRDLAEADPLMAISVLVGLLLALYAVVALDGVLQRYRRPVRLAMGVVTVLSWMFLPLGVHMIVDARRDLSPRQYQAVREAVEAKPCLEPAVAHWLADARLTRGEVKPLAEAWTAMRDREERRKEARLRNANDAWVDRMRGEAATPHSLPDVGGAECPLVLG